FDVTRSFGCVAEGVAQFLNGVVKSRVEVHEGIRGPEFLTEFLASDQVTGTFEQMGEYLERLVLQLQANAVLPQFTRTQVHIKGAEANFAGLGSGFHGRAFGLPGSLSKITSSVVHQILRACFRKSSEFIELDE